MKSLVLTEFVIPEAHESVRKYAERIGADFSSTGGDLAPYDRVAYIGPFCAIRDDAPDLFEQVPSARIGLFRESLVKTDPSLEEEARRRGLRYRHYSWDVVVSSKPFFELMQRMTRSELAIHLLEHPDLIHELDYRFNRPFHADSRVGQSRLASWIINYAEIGDLAEIRSQIRKDLEDWKSPRNYRQNIAFFANDRALGDVVCTEPVARYLRDEVYPGENLVIVAPFPELFTHLGVPVFPFDRPLPDANRYFWIPAFGEHHSEIQAHYLRHSRLHGIDFCSQLSIGKILSPQKKRIQLTDYSQDPKVLASLSEKIDPQLLRECILVHPGKHFPSKNFPALFWVECLKALQAKGLKPVLIGKSIDERQGVVDFPVPEGIPSLINRTSLRELIAALRLSKGLLSNDSGVLHLAGAFDNWIFALLSCKEWDAVMPFRNGTQEFKALELNRGLVFPPSRFRPNDINPSSLSIETCSAADIIKILPPADEVADRILTAFRG